jgi:Tfp pilus assembly protein PilV
MISRKGTNGHKNINGRKEAQKAQKRQKGREGRRGVTLMETLVCTAVLAVSLMGLGTLGAFSFGMETRVDDQGIACSLARNAIESVKMTGFAYTPEIPASSPQLAYYDATESAVAASASRYTVSTTVVSDLTVSGSNPVTPAPNALRTVTVTVTRTSTGEPLAQMVTYLCQGGI